MGDVLVPGKTREFVLNFVDWELFGNPAPVRSPNLMQDQIPIAHPVDVLVGKLAAVSKRKALWDFADIAAESRQLPECLEEAIAVYTSSPITKESSRLDEAKTLRDYPFEVEFGLPKEDPESLAAAAIANSQYMAALCSSSLWASRLMPRTIWVNKMCASPSALSIRVRSLVRYRFILNLIQKPINR